MIAAPMPTAKRAFLSAGQVEVPFRIARKRQRLVHSPADPLKIHADQHHYDANNHEHRGNEKDDQISVGLNQRTASDGVIRSKNSEDEDTDCGNAGSHVAGPIAIERQWAGTGTRLRRLSRPLFLRRAVRQQLVPSGETSGLRYVSDLVAQFACGHEFPSRENAVQESVLFFERNKNRSIDVEDDKREEHEHQKEMNQAEVLDIDEQRQPTDEFVQNRIMQNLVIESETGQNLDQDQKVDDEVDSAARGLWPTRRAWIESQQKGKTRACLSMPSHCSRWMGT